MAIRLPPGDFERRAFLEFISRHMAVTGDGIAEKAQFGAMEGTGQHELLPGVAKIGESWEGIAIYQYVGLCAGDGGDDLPAFAGGRLRLNGR